MDTKLIKQKILDLAIRGKLVPQNPADEPASVLLERIKAEKAQLIKEGKIKKEKPLAPIEEVPFEIPESWEWTLLPDICIIPITDGTHQTPTYVTKEEGVPFISAKDVTTQKIDWSDIKYIEKNLHETLYKRIAPQKFDILLSKNGCGSGVAAIVEDDRVFDIYVTLAVIRPSLVNISPYYLLYLINSSFCKQQFISHFTGIGMPNLHLIDIKKTIIPLPPLEEQKRIVAEIDRWFKWIDELDQNQQDLHTAIKQAKSKILDLAIHGKLVPQESEWNVRTFSTVFKPLRFNQSKIAQREINKTGSYSVVTQSANFIEGYSNRYECLIKIEKPVLIFGDHTRNVKYIDFDFIIGADGVKVLSTCENPKFSYYLLLWASTQIENRGYSRHFQYLQKVPLLIPSANEQHRIVCKIEDLFAQLDKIEESLN